MQPLPPRGSRHNRNCEGLRERNQRGGRWPRGGHHFTPLGRRLSWRRMSFCCAQPFTALTNRAHPGVTDDGRGARLPKVSTLPGLRRGSPSRSGSTLAMRGVPMGRSRHPLQRAYMEGDGETVFRHACKLGLEGIVSTCVMYDKGGARHR